MTGFASLLALLVGAWALAGEAVFARPSLAPAEVVVATTRGESVVRVNTERGHPALPAPPLEQLLPISVSRGADWAQVSFAGRNFSFLLDAPLFALDGELLPLVGGAYVARDTLFVPLQWLSYEVPRRFSEAYQYDPLAGRFEELRLAPVVTTVSRPSERTVELASLGRPASQVAARNGFKFQHRVVLDPGHGGRDPGNPGIYFPRGVKEKHVVLQIARRLKEELESRGVEVVMTRNRDRFVGLNDRGATCREECDLFVSIHVNSLARRSGYTRVSGVETYFLAEALTANARRVAQMENSALRYETESERQQGLGFILRDLLENEFLRESAELAQTVQDEVGAIHPGRNRGVFQANFAVLRAARRPAVLVEVGYSTNPTDGKFLTSSAGQAKLARAISRGVVGYLKEYEFKLLAEVGN